jgi:hypothetical protein
MNDEMHELQSTNPIECCKKRTLKLVFSCKAGYNLLFLSLNFTFVQYCDTNWMQPSYWWAFGYMDYSDKLSFGNLEVSLCKLMNLCVL